MFKDMFQPVDLHRAAEVRNFFKFHMNQLLFFFHSWTCLEICIFALVIKEYFFLFKSSQQQRAATTL